MMFPALVLLILGLVIVLYGADAFVKGAASIAKKMNVPPLVIGLTIVAFGTSTPELTINIFSAIQGTPDLAVGNILGSNIANILLILGIAAIVRPLAVQQSTTWKEIPFAFLAILVFFFLVNDTLLGSTTQNFFSRGDGLVLLSIFAIFMVYVYGLTKAQGETVTIVSYSWTKSILFILFGMITFIIGGKLIVDNATILALAAGLSELFIGLTITAIGTSLPELAISVVAAYKGHADLAVGNVVGSNIFNILWILGITSVISPFTIDPIVNFDIIIGGVATILLFLFLLRGGTTQRYTICRWEGILFIILYMGYIGYITIRG